MNGGIRLEESKNPTLILADGSKYDTLKWIVMIVLPAIATLYAALAPVWSWPRPEDVVLTLNAVTAFAGALLGISTAQYNKDNPVDAPVATLATLDGEDDGNA